MAEQSSLVRLQNDYDLELDWRPFELHPETPPGGMPLAQYFPEPRLTQMREHLRRFAAGFGIHDLDAVPHLANTQRVLAMAEYARDQGRVHAFRDVAMKAYWRERNGLETDDDLRKVAERAGLDPDKALAAADDASFRGRVKALSEEGRRRGVSGIPTFFIGDQPVVGCQPYQTLAMVAERAGAKRRAEG